MRQIKFRVFDKNDGMFLVDGLVGTSKGMRVSSVLQIPEDCDPECYTLEPWEWEYSDDDVLMQFTGLKDKNGVEIYEGDIVKAYSFINGNFIDKTFSEHVVVYKHYGFTLDYIPQKQHTLSLYQDELEVIGNIYQNPELLESK